jgi:LysR family transcriptional regulator, glycine cleavage system transcriptional activator
VSQPLPPLNSLRAFEATARHLSFSKAAVELHVTPAALSHQIAGLEKRLAVRLFERRVRGIELTDAGRLIYPGIYAAFKAMAAALQPLDNSAQDKTLVISSTPGFAVKWLVPRLHGFLEKHPDIDTRISSSLQVTNFTDGVDVAIRYVVAELPKGTLGQALARDTVVPLCSPHLRTGSNPLLKPGDLAKHTLIHLEMPAPFPSPPGWPDWLRHVGVNGVDASRGPRFSYADHAIDAAVGGAGVALGYKVLALNDLQAGRLVIPFGPELPIDALGYYFVCAEGQERRPKIRLFREWIVTEMKQALRDLKEAPAKTSS